MAHFATPPGAASSVSRNQPCPCGSGRRYKHCCGANPSASAGRIRTVQDAPEDRAVALATALFHRGEAFAGKELLDAIDPDSLSSPQSALEAARMYRELGILQREFAFLERTLRLDGQLDVKIKMEQCLELLFANTAWDSLRRQALELIARINARGEAVATSTNQRAASRIHLANDFQAIGGSETRSFRLYQILAPFTEVILWSRSEPTAHYRALCPELRVLDPSHGDVPDGGVLVVVGNYLDITPWLDAMAACRRIVLGLNVPDLANMKRVVSALTLMESLQAGFTVDFTYPSDMWRHRVGLGGVTEYSPTDTQRFSRQRPHEQATRSLVVGRIARANWTKFHPDDPGLMRRIVGRGHVCRIMDGTLLKDALRDEAQSGRVELMPLDAMDARAFLEGLDCFLYWKHPLWVETGPNAILEAMAMELPVIVFGRDVGVAELIEHGRDGFLVETEEEALACLDRLADSPVLRQSVGQAARRKVLAVLEKQEKHILDFYLKADGRRIPTPHSA